MTESSKKFYDAFTQDAVGTGSWTISNSTTSSGRSNTLYAPALSRLSVNISGTASVAVKSNPFGDPAKDVTLTTISATGEYLIPNAAYIALVSTITSGTVTAELVTNDD